MLRIEAAPVASPVELRSDEQDCWIVVWADSRVELEHVGVESAQNEVR